LTSAIVAIADAASAAGTVSGSRHRGHWTSVPIFFRPTFSRLWQFWQRKTTGICASDMAANGGGYASLG
jgi:hypothetical protein